MSEFVFHDPSGRRARRAALIGGLILATVAAVVAAFFATLAFAPRLPDVHLKDPRVLSALHVETARKVKFHPTLTRVPRRPKDASGAASKPLTVGFYAPWDERSRVSLNAHIGQLDVFAPQWITPNGSLGRLTVLDDPQTQALLAKATHKPSVLPVIHNSHNGYWDGPLADALLLNPAARTAFLTNLVTLAKARGYAGYIFDFEDLSPEAMKVYPQLIRQANQALDPLQREIWVTTLFGEDPDVLDQLQAASDTVVLMAYDEHWSSAGAGPVSGQDWFEQNLDKQLSHLDEAKTIVALGSYGYDWVPRDKSGHCQGMPAGQKDCATRVGFHEATQIADDSGADVSFDQGSLNPTYDYDDSGVHHTVWFLDAPTMFNQIKAADDYRPRGYALWYMGVEDPGVWSILPHEYGKASAASLSLLPPSQDVDFDGNGEVLKVTATPKPGKRTFSTDPDTGLIADERYDVMPTAYDIQRYGAKKGLVALTFDDGPDPRWTPQILDILKAKHAPATFFVIGQNMQRYPGLVAREIKDGDQVGSHTYTHPNIAATPVPETDLELNLTQRLFEVITGRSLRLFRPPYFGDAEPSTPAEVQPLITAQKLGYLIVGLRVDPDDWQKPEPQQIVDRTLAAVDAPDPNDPRAPTKQIVLLHDSGGNRERTIQALPQLIDELRANGYRLTTVGELAGLTPDQAMPPVKESLELTLDRIGFSFFRYVDAFFRFLFVSAIALGVGRLVFLSVLSVFHSWVWKRRRPPAFDPDGEALVTVLIPCFNEEKVIVGSVARILASGWKRLEVIVLDDGSSDATSAVVEKAYKDEPRVTLMTFPNGGKAAALNRGLKLAKGEVIVALDADTLFPDDTIGRLVRWFADPEVGAVAGNALVGNRLNLITRWQALEYVTAQNLERRALAALGAVTVVPGAVGAWRRAALEQLGGFPGETLAEDQDLTIAVQRAGWRVEFDPSARAYTEAPDSLKGLLKQRFRWSFGTLQCIWKHREATFSLKHPTLGFIALPQIWLFQIFLALAAPLVDLAVIYSLLAAVMDKLMHPVEWSPDKLTQSLFYWAAFVLVDLSACALGMALERRAPWKDLVWIPVQRFGYRQLMYYVVIKSVLTAIRGPMVGWGKLERRATAAVEGEPTSGAWAWRPISILRGLARRLPYFRDKALRTKV
jgi:cellulose synthase/poly-beta-1,6-N-acetylglucosamine synthase-like glycosyltransferase/peptidoglycan/xylan/chitin deacetylase (PgdA/CDA1 family)/spore germination protein YaaH